MPEDLTNVPLQNSDETVLSQSYGLQVLPQRIQVLMIAGAMLLSGFAMLCIGHRHAG